MRKIVLIAGIVVLSASAYAADTRLLNLVMPDAKVMAGVNVTTAKISPLGQYALARIAGSDAKGLDSFIAETGFDPRQDVTEILAASAGNQQQGLVLALGNFNVDKIAAAALKESASAVQQYGGATLITPDAKAAHSVAFIGASIAIAGDTASVKAAVDRSKDVNSINPTLAARVQALSTSQDAWSVAMASIAALVPGIGGTDLQGPSAQALQIVKDIQESSGGVKFGANVEITANAVTSDPKNATALADVIRMVASLASMAGAKDPNAAAASQLLQKLQVTTVDTAVNLALSVPEEQLEALLKPAASTSKAVRRAQ